MEEINIEAEIKKKLIKREVKDTLQNKKREKVKL